MNEVKVVRSHGRMNILQKDYKNFEKGTDKLRKNLIIYLKKVSLRNQKQKHSIKITVNTEVVNRKLKQSEQCCQFRIEIWIHFPVEHFNFLKLLSN